MLTSHTHAWRDLALYSDLVKGQQSNECGVRRKLSWLVRLGILAVHVAVVVAYVFFVLATIWSVYGPEGQPR